MASERRTKGASLLQERALDLIGSRSDGLLQSELSRLLCIDSARCSKVVSKMEGCGLIRRERAPGRRSYLLRLAGSRGSASLRQIDRYLTEFYLLYLIRGVPF